jgi:ribosomal protein S18 acetylase RimI-like enzyme
VESSQKSVKIWRWCDLESTADPLEQTKEIFFATSARKSFADSAEREAFFEKWTSYYLAEEPQRVYLASSSEGEVLGYLMGCLSTSEAHSLKEKVPSQFLFPELVKEFPAHLHINVAPKAQGQSIGKALMLALFEDLETRSVKGVHIVTSPEAANVRFYRRLGFTFEKIQEFKGFKLLFMGKTFL